MKVATLLARPALTSISIFWLLMSLSAQADDSNLLAEGERVFNMVAGIGCKTCHGEYAEGDVGVGPFIRGATEGMIRASINATNEMIVVKNVITEEEIQAVASYVQSLGTMQVTRTLAKRGRFLPAEFSIRPNTQAQLIIQNASVDFHTFTSDDMGIENVTIAGRSSGSVQWQAPEVEGEYSLYCTDCKLKDQFFTVTVDMAAAPFKGVAPATKVADGAM